jgi:integrase
LPLTFPSHRSLGLAWRSWRRCTTYWYLRLVEGTPHAFDPFERNAAVVQQLLGHESLATTTVYAGVYPGDGAEAVALLGTAAEG